MITDQQLAFVQGHLVAAREVLEAAFNTAMEDDVIPRRIALVSLELRKVIAYVSDRVANEK